MGLFTVLTAARLLGWLEWVEDSMTTLVFLMALLRGPTAADLGPSVGQPLPAFQVPDQDGRPRSFESLRGPKGLLLVFFRSADW